MEDFNKYLRNSDWAREQALKDELREEETKRSRKTLNERRKKEAFRRYQEHLRAQLAAQYGHTGGDGIVSTFSNTYSLAFDGSNDRFDDALVSGSSALEVASGAMMAWVKPADAIGSGADQTMITYNIKGSRSYFELVNLDDGKMQLTYRLWGDVWRLRTDDVVFTADATWYHVAARNNNDGNGPDLFINGAKVDSTYNLGGHTALNAWLSTKGVINYRLGSRDFNGGYQLGYEGNIDEAAFIPGSVSDATILAIGGAGKAVDLTNYNPAQWYRMEEGTGTTVENKGNAVAEGLTASSGSLTNGTAFDTDNPG